MSDDDRIIPFGKHKGEPIEVLRGDPGYREWLLGQDWFRQRHPDLVQVIINNYGAPAETPEHNRLVNRFLDRGFAVAFALHAAAAVVSRQASMARDSEWARDRLALWTTSLDRLHALDPAAVVWQVEQEVGGWDVALACAEQFNFRVEVKPTLGDDYPAVLRQMKANRDTAYNFHGAILVGQVTAEGATLDQLRLIFRQSGFHFVLLSDLSLDNADG